MSGITKEQMNMKIGKVPENILKRAVFKQIHHRRQEVLLHPGVGEDCAAVAPEQGEVFVLSTDPITGADKQMGVFAVHITANDLATAGAEPIGILSSIILPPETEEQDLRRIMSELEQACDELQIEILGGHTEVSDAVNRPVITVTGVGKVARGDLLSTGGMRPGDELVMTKRKVVFLAHCGRWAQHPESVSLQILIKYRSVRRQ